MPISGSARLIATALSLMACTLLPHLAMWIARKWPSRRWLSRFVVVVALGIAPAHGAELEPGRLEMSMEGGALSARIARVPLAAVLAEITRLTGAEIVGLGSAGAREVTASITEMPLAVALERILPGRNYYLVLSGPEKISRVVLLQPRAADGTVVQTPAVVAVDRPDTSGIEPAVAMALASHDPGVLMELLASAAALPRDDPRRGLVLERLVADPDPTVRTAALDAQLNVPAPRSRHGRSRRRPR